jgi:hypothetical protein
MRIGHRHYEVASALAASGQLTDEEFADFAQHLSGCSECQGRIEELIVVGSQISLVGASRTEDRRVPKGMMMRFVERAAREGLPLKHLRRVQSGYSRAGVLALASLCLVLACVNWAFKPHENKGTQEARADSAQSKRFVGRPEEEAESRRVPVMAVRHPRHARAVRYKTACNPVPSPDLFFNVDLVKSVPLGSPVVPQWTSDSTGTLRSISLWTSGPQQPRIFVPSRSTFEPSRGRIEDLFLRTDQSSHFGKRDVSYNPKIASLTLLEAFHASTPTEGRGVEMPTFRFTLLAMQ